MGFTELSVAVVCGLILLVTVWVIGVDVKL